MHLSAAIPVGGGGVTPGTYGGIERDLLTFVANVWPGTVALSAFALPRQDTRGKTNGICNIATILTENERSVPRGLGTLAYSPV